MKKFFYIILISLTLQSCSNSPIFNHENAEDKRNQFLGTNPTACELSFSESGLCAEIEWIEGPSGNGSDSFYLRFWNPDSSNSSGPFEDPGYDVVVEPKMSCCGSSSNKVPVLSKEEEGVYKVTNVSFPMPGKWDLKIKLMETGTLIEESARNFSVY